MAPEDALPCGASAGEVALGALRERDEAGAIAGHGPSCRHCRARHEQERTRWSRASAELARHEPAPPRVRRAVLRRVRATGRGGAIETGSSERGRTTVADGVLTDLAVRAVARTHGIEEITRIEIEASREREVDLAVEVTASLDWSRPLPQLAQAVRHAIGVHLTGIADVGVGRVAVTFTDVVQ